MKKENIFETMGSAQEKKRAEGRRRLEIAVEIERLLDQMEAARDSDVRGEIEGQIRQLLEQGRRILEKGDVEGYYKLLESLKRSAA
jgi:hypothetical protein